MGFFIKWLTSVSGLRQLDPTVILVAAIFCWGFPSAFMLVIPAYYWGTGQLLTVGEFACAVGGLGLLLAYTKFCIWYIGFINGKDWLHDQVQRIFEEDQ